jgi:hypothetical protein
MRAATFAVAGTAIALTLAMTASAFARTGDRPFVKTYPAANALCVKAESGTLSAKLAPSAAAVSAACDTLGNAFPTLVSTVDTAEATLLDTISAQKALVAAACRKPVSNHAACAGARAGARSTDTAARTTEKTAEAAFHGAVAANGKAFWNTVSALR